MSEHPWGEDATTAGSPGQDGWASSGGATPPADAVGDTAPPGDGAPEMVSPPGEAPLAEGEFKLGQRVWGPILRLTEDQAVVSLSEQGIAEGTLDLMHLRDEYGNLSVSEGDEVQAFIVQMKPTIKLAPTLDPPATEVIRRLREAMDRNENVRGRVAAVNRGGLEIYIDGRRAFCPYSQIEIGRCENAEIYLNRILDFRVTEIDEEKKRVILSRRPVLEKERQAKLGDLRAQIREGVEFDGVVRRVQAFGAFVDIGGVEGLVHVSEISHDRVDNPEQVLHPGEKVRVKVLGVSQGPDGRERIKLSMRATMLDPWTKVADLFHEGDIITGKVMRLTEFGAFVRLHPGIEGLLHISQYKPRAEESAEAIAAAAALQDPGDNGLASETADQTPVAGEDITVRISRIEPQRKRISLALRDEERRDRRPAHDAVVGETVEGVVRTVKNYGVFLDLPSIGPWVSGLLPAIETGLGREVNLARKYRKGDKVRVEIIDIEERGIRLSQKRLIEAEEAGAPPSAAASTGGAAAPGDATAEAKPPALSAFALAMKRAEERQTQRRQG